MTSLQISWVNWMKGAENFEVAPGTAYSDIMIPTLDTIRSAYVIHMLITNKKPVCIVCFERILGSFLLVLRTNLIPAS